MTTSFFNGESTFPENNTTDALIDALEVQLAKVTADSQAVQDAATSAAASANNAAISEANVAGLSQTANDSLALANEAIDLANAASALANTAATTAANAASSAAGSSATATTAAADAAASATAADASEAAALASKNAAATSQSDALASKNAAAASATSASGSATTATTQAGIATTQAGTATTQATAASGSASSASSSASAAATSATASASSATAAAASANLAANSTIFLSGRNRIINGCFRVAQRTSANIGATPGFSGPDRWFANASNVGSFSQSASTMGTTDGTRPCGLQTVVTAATAGAFGGTNLWNGFDQRIEGFNCYDMLGKPAVLSFWFFSNNVSGLFNVAISDKTESKSFVTQFSATAGVAVKVVIPVPALPTSLVTTFDANRGLVVRIGAINNGTLQSTSGNLNTWQTGQFMAGPSAGTAHWPGAVGNLIAVTEVQLESGTAVTPFERRPIQLETLLCQRYALAIPGRVMGQCFSTTAAFAEVPLPTPMRSAPTYVSGGTSNVTGSNAANIATTSVSAVSPTSNAVEISVTVASGLVAGNATAFLSGGGLLSAEL